MMDIRAAVGFQATGCAVVPLSKVARHRLTVIVAARDDSGTPMRDTEKMNGKLRAGLRSLCVALVWIGAGVAEEATTQVETPAAAAPDRGVGRASAAETARRECISQCEAANGNCNSQVRQARQECSRNAANSGRDPMTFRNNDYTYFCSYFRDPGRRGPGNFAARFAQHYDLCVNVMQQNIASMRYDCFRNERDAQNICRAELRECQAACQ